MFRFISKIMVPTYIPILTEKYKKSFIFIFISIFISIFKANKYKVGLGVAGFHHQISMNILL